MERVLPEDLGVPLREAQRLEGEALFREGKVKILEGRTATAVEAEVAFFKRFQRVQLERVQGSVSWECTCPFRENEKAACSHVWALALASAAESSDPSETPWTPLYGVLARAGATLRVAVFESLADGDPAIVPVLLDGVRLYRPTPESDKTALRRIENAGGGRRNLLQGGGLVEPKGPWPIQPEAVLEIARTGRAFLVSAAAGGGFQRGPAILPEAGPPLHLHLSFEPSPAKPEESELVARLVPEEGQGFRARDADVFSTERPPCAIKDGRVMLVSDFGAREWLSYAAKDKTVRIPTKDVRSFLSKLAGTGALPKLSLPGLDKSLPVLRTPPIPCFLVSRRGIGLEGQIRFLYGAHRVSLEDPAELILGHDLEAQIGRDRVAERGYEAELAGLEGLDRDPTTLGRFDVERAGFEKLAAGLIERGYRVEAEGKIYRPAGTPSLRLHSGIDWFELDGVLGFEGDAQVSLKDAMDAWTEGRRFVTLGDGSTGLLPSEWMMRLERVLDLSTNIDGRPRFRRAQALLLEPLLDLKLRDVADQDLLTILQSLSTVSEATVIEAPPNFRGVLRPYQRHGFAWLRSLAETGLGGCLADDMGLGKTVQALALLASLRASPPPKAKERRPFLVVCPKSLLWNWQEEAARFAPELRITQHHGSSREFDSARLEREDLVMTTYGTLQRDIDLLSTVTFDAVILDEAQAIKNPKSKTALAAQRLQARTRVSLTGTPIENSLRDLWSQMEFLNPGLLGSEERFLATLGDREGGASRAVLARALKPLILRRTKDEVLPELPPRVEQTLFAELSERQERLYSKLKAEARAALAKQVKDEGIVKARFHVLESLLRLRQVACHPGLLDANDASAESGKLDLLMEELEAVLEGGHKALIFSQFVTFLKLAASRLDAANHSYAYLDGSTQNRQAVVQRFQNDPECRLFLISLKAGGLGLNLTAADYVFILDPWWNPAVEAQAIDRTHRIGQKRTVFAYRIVAKGTVEEKILALQERKRDLADAILNANEGPLAALTEEDLQMLLG